MAKLNRVENIFTVPSTWSNPVRTGYDPDIPTHRNEKLDYSQFHDAPGVDPPPFSVFENIDRYWTYLYVMCFPGMQIDENQLPFHDPKGRH